MLRIEMSIVMASDSGYMPFAYITMYSILKTRKLNYHIDFYIMVPVGTDEVEYDKNWPFSDYRIQYLEISDKYFKNVDMKIDHITKPTYYRLLIAEYLKEVDKCIYLDVDTLIYDDLLDLYKLDMGTGYLAAGRGVSFNFSKERSRSLAEYLGIPTADNYVNAGVLVMNLKKIRENNLTQQFLACSEKKWICQDQDVLNICCYDRIKIFPLKYNLYSAAYNYKTEMLENRFTRSEIKEALKNPCIIHYASKTAKPWYNLRAIKGKQWWDIAGEALPQNLYDRIRAEATEVSKKMLIPDSIQKFDIFDSTILFGAGKAGCLLYNFLEKRDAGKVAAFFDNKLAGQNYKNVPIVAPVLREEQNILIIITPQTGAEEMEMQLLELGYRKEQIVFYYGTDITDFLAFDSIEKS